MPIIPVGEWAPDQAPLGNPGVSVAKNVIPAENSYRPTRDLQAAIAPLTERVRGGFVGIDSADVPYIVAGTNTTLNVYNGFAFTDVSKVGGYSTTADNRWEFASFDTRVIASNFNDPIQVKDLNDPIATDFADLFTSTLTPQARHIAVVAAFLVMGNTNDAVDGDQPDRLWWTAFRDPTDADPDSATQSNFIPLPGAGAVRRIVGGKEYGVVFQDRAISRMTYVGGGAGSPIFDVQSIEGGRGTPVPGSIAARGRFVFYYSEDGFQLFDGSQSIPIGSERIDREFASRFDVGNRTDVFASIDPINKLYCILFPGSGSTGLPGELFCFHWPTQKWAETAQIAEIIFEAATQPVTGDAAPLGPTDADAGPFASSSMDSSVFKGGEIQAGAFDSTHALAFFNGMVKPATVTTQERQLFNNRLSKVNKVRPLVNGGDPRIRALYRDAQNETQTTGIQEILNGDGQADIDITARYHSFQIELPAGDTWDHIQGVQIEDDQIEDMGVL